MPLVEIRMHPRVLLVYPLPPNITAAVGMDALSHNLEAYCSPFYHPMAEGIALKAISLIKEWLPTAVSDGQNIEASPFCEVAGWRWSRMYPALRYTSPMAECVLLPACVGGWAFVAR